MTDRPTGLRNCQGMTIQPATGELWCGVNERDEIGDNTRFEYATHVTRRRVLRLALVLHRRAPGIRATRVSARISGTGHRPGRLHASAFGAAADDLLPGDGFPAGYKGSASSRCTARGTATTHGLQGRALISTRTASLTGEYEDS